MNAGNKNTPSMHRPQRRNVTTPTAGLKQTNKQTVTHAKISPQMVNPRDIVGNTDEVAGMNAEIAGMSAEEEEEEEEEEGG